MSAPVGPAANLDLRAGHPPILHSDGGADPVGWTAHHRNEVRQILARYGSVLVRGLGLRDHAQTAAVMSRLTSSGLLPEREPFAPRTQLGQGLQSATPWPASQQMCLHNELSYVPDPPAFIMFACLTPPAGGGVTPVGDGSAVLQALPPALVSRFEQEGWLLVRHYNDDIGASWAEAFGTGDRGAVEHYCRGAGIEFTWDADGGLRTRQRRRAVVRHPVDGRPCWFNQVAFLSEWALDPDVREYLVEMNGPDGLPFTTRFGNGEPIPEDVVAVINQAYDAHTLREPWQAGDLLVVDNVRTAHGRDAYEGDRTVVVGMGDPIRL
ncbi:TauD/TfdA family dioxygenase [Actinomycetospora termitidis]|uniref:TauD/TfdA family dioxygenase n=1 Tax=Actinomycetospora termitidis TaxID=3053470 RepID=A0ABT7MEP0_9PSEU|nr:TauD/TfdA family dioxygenase [Actinomycetospora sp. Odt1-22]MDL5158357.1 TauD/TfdA family dioxygenase [Actinomycetospora sp. Odt1-22]